MTYEAKVTVPSWAKCLMSALEKTSENGAAAVEEEGEKVTFSWKQPVPMPSYLIAIAVGELESRDISPRFDPATHAKVFRTRAGDEGGGLPCFCRFLFIYFLLLKRAFFLFLFFVFSWFQEASF